MISTKMTLKKLFDLPPVFIPLVIVLVFNIVLNNNILSFDGFNNLFIEFTPIVLAVMAQTMALLVREMDLSVGSMISLSTVVMSTTMGHFGYFSILIVLVMAVVIGFINGWIVAYIKAPGIVVTLAVSMILSGIALVILPNPGGVIPESFSNLLMDNYIFLPNSMFLVLIVLLIWKFIKRSRIGQSLYATGANYYSAYATGIKVKRYKIFGYIGSSVLASLAAMMLCAKTMTGDALIGNSFTLTSISGAILGGVSFFGGIGKMKGAVAGAMVIAILVNILQFLNVSSFYQYMVEGAILILAVTLSIPKIKIKVEN